MTSLSDTPCLIEHELNVENTVWILHTLSTWECSLMSISVPGGVGRYSVILYIRRLGPFLGLKILNFNIYIFLIFFLGGGGGGGVQKNEYFWGV